MAPFAIRRATRADAARLAVVGRETFVATFGDGYPPADLAAFLASAYGPEHQAEEIDDPTAITLLAEEGSRPDEGSVDEGRRVVGFVQAGEMGLPFDTEGRVAFEIKRVYLVASAQGSGLAQELLRRAVAWAEERGAEDLYLGVWSQNARALAFYRREGFEVVGAYTFMVGDVADDERIMRRRLRG